MKIKLMAIAAFLLVLGAGIVCGDSVIVSQVDNSTLLANQLIRVYVSVTDGRGNPIPDLEREPANFKLFEGIPDSTAVERPIVDLRGGANVNEGISILFLLDNSGSMYTDIAGRDTTNASLQRIAFAKKAIDDLLLKIKNPADRLGLVTFNIRTDTVIGLTDDKATISKALAELKKPAENEGYTELYESLYFAVERLKHVKGRKVIVLLSDGENFPFTGENPPQFGERKGLPAAIEYAQQEGISVFTIGFLEGAQNADLARIAGDTGGVNYPVRDANRLNELYNQIRDRVLGEYLITYSAGMEPADRKYVTVKVVRNGATLASEPRSYFSATIFGVPQQPFPFWIFASLLIGLGLLFLLFKTDFQKKKAAASLEVLTVDGKKSNIDPVTIMEGQRQVTISGSTRSDLTISGEPKLLRTEVSVKQTGGEYTISSDGEDIKVNNQPVKSKKLRSGDLISIGGTTIVFDGGFDKARVKALTGFRPRRNKNVQTIPRRSGKHRR